MTMPEETVQQLAELAGVVLAQEDLHSTLVEICRIAVRAVPGADGASITTMNEGRPQAIGSDEWSAGFDELQYAEHEGPCFDSFRTGTIYRIRNLAEEARWPSWVPRARERGAASTVSLPMAAEANPVGALNLYSRSVDAFPAEAVSVAEIIAGHAGLASQVAAAFFRHRDLAVQLSEAIESRATIEQAKGILMAGRRCTPDEAFQILVSLSQSSNRKLREVARALVAEAAGPAR